MTARALTARFARSLRAHGAVGTAALLLRLAGQQLAQVRPATVARWRRRRAIDARLNIRTRGQVALSSLQIDSPNADLGVKYQPSPPADFRALMDRLEVDHERFTFVDLGAGKGICLCLAAAYPFRQIVGVEFSPALAAIARDNVARLHLPQQRCHDLLVVCADAAHFAFPPDPLVVYLFNPFQEPVVRGVLANLLASLAATPRPVFVVYYNAIHGALFAADGRFTRVLSLGPPDVGEPSAIFRAAR